MSEIARYQRSDLLEWPLLTFLPLVRIEEVSGAQRLWASRACRCVWVCGVEGDDADDLAGDVVYSGSFETRFKADVARLSGVAPGDTSGFIAALDHVIRDNLTADYWGITLPNDLATSAAKSPALLAYIAALNILDAEVLLSTTPCGPGSTQLSPSRGHRAASPVPQGLPEVRPWHLRHQAGQPDR